MINENKVTDAEQPMPANEMEAVEPVAETPEQEPETDILALQEAAPAETGGDSVNKLTEVVKRFFPEADTSTPEALMASLVPLVESIVSFHDDMKEVVEEVPEFADLLILLRKGYSPQEAISMSFDPESLTPPEGAPDYEGVMKAKNARKETAAAKKARLESIDNNIVNSRKNIDALAAEKGWDEPTKNKFMDEVQALIIDGADGNLKPEFLTVLSKGFGYDEAVAQSFDDGLVTGRNEQISKKRITKETGDGLPKMSNTGSMNTAKKDEFTTGLEKLANRKPIL